MGISQVIQQVVQATTVVPRLYSAARRAGAGRRDAVEVLRISEAALRTATHNGVGVPGRINAMRHFMWQAVLTARLDLATAQAIAAAQEVGSPDRRDSRVDLHNNAVGQEYGDGHAPDLRFGTLGSAFERLVPVAQQKWDSGELTWVSAR